MPGTVLGMGKELCMAKTTFFAIVDLKVGKNINIVDGMTVSIKEKNKAVVISYI